jgi:hypothetical protein
MADIAMNDCRYTRAHTSFIFVHRKWKISFTTFNFRRPRKRLRSGEVNTEDSGLSLTWDRCYDIKIFLPKHFAFSAQTSASFYKNLIITLFFLEKRQFILRKLAKIAENYDKNIDP